MIYALTAMRATIEAMPSPEVVETPTTINILPVASNQFLVRDGIPMRLVGEVEANQREQAFFDYIAEVDPVFVAAQLIRAKIPPAKESTQTDGGGGGIDTVNIIQIPFDHGICPDGHYRPNFEARAMERAQCASWFAGDHRRT
jgi:hypothetical protein